MEDVADLIRSIALREAEDGEPPPEIDYPGDLPHGLAELCGPARDRIRVTARGYEAHCPDEWARIEAVRARGLAELEPGEHDVTELGEARHVTAALQVDGQWTGRITRSLYADRGVWERVNRRWQWREVARAEPVSEAAPAPAAEPSRKGIGGRKRDALRVLLEQAATEGVPPGVRAIWGWLQRRADVKVSAGAVRIGDCGPWTRQQVGSRWSAVRNVG